MAALVLAAVLLVIVLSVTAQAEPPATAKKLIAKYKLGPDVVADWEVEQAVPPAWIDGAKKEGKLRISGSWDTKVFREMVKPFSERYPFVNFNYTHGTNDTRIQTPLIALRSGRTITDIVTGVEARIGDFREINGLENLGDLPNLKFVPDDMKSREGEWVGVRIRYWCISYNTTLIGKDRMPKVWDDLLTTRELHNGQLALWRGVTNWLLPLWNAKGEAWTTNYIEQLFSIVQPQKRKEGSIALVNLVIAGEFKASAVSAEYQVKDPRDKGAPVAFHCPDPVPVTGSSVSVIRNNPNINASKLFMNWLISKEGQVAQFASDGSPPVHSGLQDHGFMPFPEEIAGKKIAVRGADHDDTEALVKVLRPYMGGAASSGE